MTVPLPSILSPADAAQFNTTVAPYLVQAPQWFQFLRDQVSVVTGGGRVNVAELQTLYYQSNPAVTALTFALAIAPIFVLVALITGNYSQVDRFWSILPTLYNVHYALWARRAGLDTARLDSVALLSLAWGARLTFNYARKGGYKFGSEDYRWPALRAAINNRFLFFLFNVFFIGLTQNLLLWAITTPTYLFVLLAPSKSTSTSTSTFGISDLVFSRLIIFWLLIETIADEQQWRYQKAKRAYRAGRKPQEGDAFDTADLERGFNISGLWSFSRHPNFAAEQAIWVTLYAWAAYTTRAYLNWTVAGALGYLALFQGSTRLTEKLSAEKYPEYADYQARVGRFIPRWSVKPSSKAVKNKNQKETKRE
ncbi:hypothetical protein VTN31DRAFT_3955 [Thermomyces dupontii]|uniref:uncharacterized protein n=1 Tax=Talaromyces thermophilus TaxID=28565 RepID=UPI003742EC01